MENRNSQIDRLGEVLTRLVDFVPKTSDDLDHWYSQAKCILEDYELLRGAPHFLWHYLADADIRMKSEAYAEMQNRRIDLILQHLRRGVMPSDQDTDL